MSWAVTERQVRRENLRIPTSPSMWPLNAQLIAEEITFYSLASEDTCRRRRRCCQIQGIDDAESHETGTPPEGRQFPHIHVQIHGRGSRLCVRLAG